MIPRSVPATENLAGVALGLLGPVTQSMNVVGGAAVAAACEASVAADVEANVAEVGALLAALVLPRIPNSRRATASITHASGDTPGVAGAVPTKGPSPTAASRPLTMVITENVGAAGDGPAAAVITATSSVGVAGSADAADIVTVIAFAVVPFSTFDSVTALGRLLFLSGVFRWLVVVHRRLFDRRRISAGCRSASTRSTPSLSVEELAQAVAQGGAMRRLSDRPTPTGARGAA